MEIKNIDGTFYKEIKTADKKKYMIEYHKKKYPSVKDKVRRVKNTARLLSNYDVDEDVVNQFGEYLFDCKELIKILKDFPPELFDVIKNDLLIRENIFIRKV
jgi:TRAP-type uncharacterized transport system substrate-binding protein